MTFPRNCRRDSFTIVTGKPIPCTGTSLLPVGFPPSLLPSGNAALFLIRLLGTDSKHIPQPLSPNESTYWWRSVILFCRFCSSSPVSPSNLAIINKVTKPQRKCEDMFLTSLPARQARGRPLQPPSLEFESSDPGGCTLISRIFFNFPGFPRRLKLFCPSWGMSMILDLQYCSTYKGSKSTLSDAQLNHYLFNLWNSNQQLWKRPLTESLLRRHSALGRCAGEADFLSHPMNKRYC